MENARTNTDKTPQQDKNNNMQKTHCGTTAERILSRNPHNIVNVIATRMDMSTVFKEDREASHDIAM